MRRPPPLREPDFSKLIASVEGAGDLPEWRRRHWACSIRQIAKWLDRPTELLPARWEAVRVSVAGLHHARLGVTAKTLANHRSNTQAALRWFRKESGLPQHGVPLKPEWAEFRGRIDKPTASRLSNLMRYCSARDIAPAGVSGNVFGEYWDFRGRNTGLTCNDTARRFMIRAWNSCVKTLRPRWRLRPLLVPPRKVLAWPPWEDFPRGLRDDLGRYLQALKQVRRNVKGSRIRPCRPATIRVRGSEFMAAARMAVSVGVPIEQLASLGALLHPDVFERVLDAYWKKNGEEPNISTIDLAGKAFRMARELGCVDAAGLERLNDIRSELEHHRRSGLTPKNLALVRQVLTTGVWDEAIRLPEVLMAQARAVKDQAPIKAAVMAQLAAAIAILCFAPIRISNLVGIELEQNLIKPAGPDGPYWLAFPDYDVKNRIDLNFKFDEPLSDLIEEYVWDFRPTLLRGANGRWLFPGAGAGPKNSLLFGQQLTARVHKAVGLRITPHQFRHAAAANYLRHHPGDYETVRRFLGHRDLQTTIRFYCGLESVAATEQFGKLIRRQIEGHDDDDDDEDD